MVHGYGDGYADVEGQACDASGRQVTVDVEVSRRVLKRRRAPRLDNSTSATSGKAGMRKTTRNKALRSAKTYLVCTAGDAKSRSAVNRKGSLRNTRTVLASIASLFGGTAILLASTTRACHILRDMETLAVSTIVRRYLCSILSGSRCALELVIHVTCSLYLADFLASAIRSLGLPLVSQSCVYGVCK